MKSKVLTVKAMYCVEGEYNECLEENMLQRMIEVEV